ncbi:ABC transporter permease [Bradyrhizobium sp. dw_411]|uniref:ABC transporter permease n=1 Tax=Bradyrhizobium sp. dw_411 TaxID=2720082 RepID=UPI001BCF7367|nr:ABC transporter permease [Bradyrhizobium sp. dw_411]
MIGAAPMRKLALAIGPATVVLGILVCYFSIEVPSFATGGNASNILRQAAPLALAALGQMLVVLVAGIDISTGAVVALASVSAALTAVHFGASFGLVAGVAAGALAGATSGVAVAYLRVQPVIATIGMLSIARGLAYLFSQSSPVQGVPDSFLYIGAGTVLGIPVPFICLFLVAVSGWYWLTCTQSGRFLFALGGSEEAAAASGIDTRLWKATAYAVAGALFGLAALIYTARSASGQPTFGEGLALETIAAVVLGGTTLGGGRANVAGTILGSVIITTLSNGMDLAGVSPYLQRIMLGVVTVLIVLFSVTRKRLSERTKAKKVKVDTQAPASRRVMLT